MQVMLHRTFRGPRIEIDGEPVAADVDDVFRLFSTPGGEFLTYRGPDGAVRRALQREAPSFALTLAAADADGPLRVTAVPVGALDCSPGQTLIFRLPCA